MKKWLLLLLIFGCSEDETLVQPYLVEQNPLLQISPYPLITNSIGEVVEGDFRPGILADSAHISLWEDAEAEFPVFSFPLTDMYSPSDRLPADNVFRFVIPATNFPTADDLVLIARAYRDNALVWSDSLTGISASSNITPQITSLLLSDTLSSDLQSWPWSLNALDADSDEQLTLTVSVNIGGGWVDRFSVALAQVTPGQFTIDSSFSDVDRVGLRGGQEFRYMVSDRRSKSDSRIVMQYIINQPPQILSINFPDTLIIREGQNSATTYTLALSDPETLADIDSVVTNFYRPDDSFSSSIFQFNDDGNNGDAVAGDGIYSLAIANPNSAGEGDRNVGDWTIRYYSRDRAGNRSLLGDHIITILKEE
jgi:hypothetical protein